VFIVSAMKISDLFVSFYSEPQRSKSPNDSVFFGYTVKIIHISKDIYGEFSVL